MKNKMKKIGITSIISLAFVSFCISLLLIGNISFVSAEEEDGDADQQQQEERKLRRDLTPSRFDEWGSVDENIIFDPGIAFENKNLEDRGSFEPDDFEDDEDEDAPERIPLIELEYEVKAGNPIYLSGSGKMAGTGDVRKGYASDAAKIGSGEHPKALEAAGLTLDEFGLVNWSDAIKKGKISPLAGLTDRQRASENYEEYIIIFQAKSDYMNDVVFPHDIHSYWLDCSNCHKKIFIPKAGANPVTMKKIVAGQYCGRCHGKVAFPLEECKRCHVKPKSGGKFVEYPIFNEFQEEYNFK